MSVQTRRFFVKPTTSLLARLISSQSDLVAVLTESTLWTQTLGGRSRVTFDESVQFIKLLHVCNMISEYGADEDFQTLTGGGKVSIEFFDANWELNCVDFEESAEKVLERLPKEMREQLERVTTHQS